MPPRRQSPYVPWKSRHLNMDLQNKGGDNTYRHIQSDYLGKYNARFRYERGQNEDFLPVQGEKVLWYRNNLIACSKYYNFLFIPFRDRIEVFQPVYPNQNVSKPLLSLQGPETLPHLQRPAVIPPRIKNSVNNLIVADLGDEEVLLAANDSGYVGMWYTRHIEERQGQMDIWFDVEKSAWGVAVHKSKRLIAVSSNTSIIYVYEMGNEAIDPTRQPSGLTPLKYISCGHNIPCISFLEDDPEGRWLSATDIEGNLYLYDLLKRKSTHISLHDQTGWTVTLVPESDFISVDHKELTTLIEKTKDLTSDNEPRNFLVDSEEEASDDENDNDEMIYLLTGPANNTQPDPEPLHASVLYAAMPEATSSEQPSLDMSEEAQDDAYGTLDIPMSDFLQQLRSHKPINLLHSNQNDWEIPPPSFIIYTNELDLQLVSTKPCKTVPKNGTEEEKDVYLTNLITHPYLMPSNILTNLLASGGRPIRMNMKAYIPSLGLFIIGRQDGNVALVRLLKSSSTSSASKSSTEKPDSELEYQYHLNKECILPEPSFQLPRSMLAGVAVSPLQGWGERDIGRGIGEKRGQSKWLYSRGETGGKWRLWLLYTDGTLICYLLKARGSDREEVIEALIV